MIAAVEVAPRTGYRIWLRYSDGVSGEVDLSDLAGRGIFGAWLDRSFFEKVHVSPYGSIAWSEEVELCEDALYLRLTGKSVEEVMPAARLPWASRHQDELRDAWSRSERLEAPGKIAPLE